MQGCKVVQPRKWTAKSWRTHRTVEAGLRREHPRQLQLRGGLLRSTSCFRLTRFHLKPVLLRSHVPDIYYPGFFPGDEAPVGLFVSEARPTVSLIVSSSSFLNLSRARHLSFSFDPDFPVSRPQSRSCRSVQPYKKGLLASSKNQAQPELQVDRGKSFFFFHPQVSFSTN